MRRQPESGDLYQFLDFELRVATQELCRGDTCTVMSPKSFELLAFLVSNPGELLSKQVLLQEVWSDRRVEDAALKSAIMELRKLLSDHDRETPIIKTVIRRGYLFVPEVTHRRHVESDAGAPTSKIASPRALRSRWATWVVPLTVLAALLVLWPQGGQQGSVTAAQRLAVVPLGAELDNNDAAGFAPVLHSLLLHRGYTSLVAADATEKTISSFGPKPADAAGEFSELRLVESVMALHGASFSVATDVERDGSDWLVRYLLKHDGADEIHGRINAQSLESAAERLVAEIERVWEPASEERSMPTFLTAVQAEGEGRTEEAIRLYEAVISEDRKSDGEGTANMMARVRLAQLLARSGYAEKALELHNEIMTMQSASLDAAAIGNLLTSLAGVQIGSRQFDQAKQNLIRVLTEYAPSMNKADRAETYRQLGRLSRALGSHDEARAHFAQALALLSGGDAPAEEIELMNSMGSLEFHQGNSHEAIAHYNAGLALAERYGLIGAQRRLNRNLGATLRAQGRWREADEILALAYAQATTLQDSRGLAYTAFSQALVQLALGDGQAAVESSLSAIEHASALDDWLVIAHAHDVAAEALAKMGAIERALTHFANAIEVAGKVDASNDIWLFRLQRSNALYRAGRIAAPLEEIDEALAEFDAAAPISYAAITEFYRGEYLWTQADCSPFAAAMDRIKGLGHYHLEAETALTFADCLLDLGDIEQARQLTNRAGVWKTDYYLHHAVQAKLHWLDGNKSRARELLSVSRKLAGDHWTPKMQNLLVEYTAASVGQ